MLLNLACRQLKLVVDSSAQSIDSWFWLSTAEAQNWHVPLVFFIHHSTWIISMDHITEAQGMHYQSINKNTEVMTQLIMDKMLTKNTEILLAGIESTQKVMRLKIMQQTCNPPNFFWIKKWVQEEAEYFTAIVALAPRQEARPKLIRIPLSKTLFATDLYVSRHWIWRKPKLSFGEDELSISGFRYWQIPECSDNGNRSKRNEHNQIQIHITGNRGNNQNINFSNKSTH